MQHLSSAARTTVGKQALAADRRATEQSDPGWRTTCTLCVSFCQVIDGMAVCAAAVLRQLAQEGSAEFVGYQNSTLMQLLSGTAC